MKHYGDITKIKGSDVPIVDIVCGGSPCQDLSVAGKRQGLSGQRSGLFMEQIRIIKEMRDYDKRNRGTDVDIRFLSPRFMVWENVLGAFSSNGGEDFRAVLEETAKIVCEDAVIPRPEGGKWSHSGCILGDKWSIAWRVHDAQFWGVPQRRKRISLVADFGGQSAPEILFERKGLSGNTEESGAKGQAITDTVKRSLGETSRNEKMKVVVSIGNGQLHDAMSPSKQVSKTLNCMDDPAKIVVYSETVGALTASDYKGVGSQFVDQQKHVIQDNRKSSDSLFKIIENHPMDSRIGYTDVFPTLNTRMGTGGNNVPMIEEVIDAIVRKITPLECERLQGYPDGWTNIGDWIDSKGKKRKGEADAPRYKALGNSIALPFWEWMAQRMVDVLKKDNIEHTTMASLFDGIGGFPLVFSRCGCNPIWASEIEEFPIAVTKIRFPEGE